MSTVFLYYEETDVEQCSNEEAPAFFTATAITIPTKEAYKPNDNTTNTNESWNTLSKN